MRPLVVELLTKDIEAPLLRRETARRSGHRLDITAFVRPNIGESITLEPDHHFRQSLVRNSKHHRVPVDRPGRRLSRVEPQPKLAENLVHRGGSLVPLGSVHHHDRVSQSRISVQVLNFPLVPTLGTIRCRRREG